MYDPTDEEKKRLTDVLDASSEPLAQFFKFGHLPAPLQTVSAQFGVLAVNLLEAVPRNAERTVALRKLVEAKDCAVRAVIFKQPEAK